jgi:plastocyanin domain-containing protein
MLAKVIVTVIGGLVIVLLNWYFLLPRRKS